MPPELHGPSDLIVSRRGPTSVIPHLPALAAPNARFLYVGPTLDGPQVPERLQAIGWDVCGEWRASVRAWAPTWEDWQMRCEFMGVEARRDTWKAQATPRGLAYREERYPVLAGPS